METTQRRRKHYIPEPRKFVALNDTALFILEHVIKRRFLTTAHILMLIDALDGSLQQTRRLLRDVVDGGYLTRIRHPLKRKQNAGSYSLIYAISNAGAEALAAEGRVPRDHVDWDRRNKDVNDPATGKGIKAVPHGLLISDVLTELEAWVIRNKGVVRLIDAQELRETVLPETTRKRRYPFSWRVRVPSPRLSRPTDGGEAVATIDHRIVPVAPDAVFALEFAQTPGKLLVYFLEADRSVPNVMYTLETTTTFRKLLAYAGTWSQDIHRTRFNFPSFQVLTVTTKSKAHVDNMVAAFQLLDRQVMPVWDKPCPGRIFLFADRASADPSKLLGYAWVNGKGTSKTFDVSALAPKPVALEAVS